MPTPLAPAWVRGPHSPQLRRPQAVVASNRRGLVAIDKAPYRSWRSPSSQPAPAFIGAHIDRWGGRLHGPEEPGVPGCALPRAPRQRGPAYRLSHLAGQGRAPASPYPAPTFEVNKWKRLSPPPSVTRLISAAHLSLRGTKGAQRRGQLRPGFGGGAGGGGPKLGPLPSAPTAWLQVRPVRPANSCEGRTHRPGQRAGGRAPPLGDNQLLHLNSQRSAVGRRCPGPQGECPAPPPRLGPLPCPGPARVEGGKRRLAHAHAAVPVPKERSSADPAGPGRSPRSRPYRRWRSVPNLRSPCPRYLHFSSRRNTHTYAHMRTDRTEAHRGGGEKETRERAQIGTCGRF